MIDSVSPQVASDPNTGVLSMSMPASAASRLTAMPMKRALRSTPSLSVQPRRLSHEVTAKAVALLRMTSAIVSEMSSSTIVKPRRDRPRRAAVARVPRASRAHHGPPARPLPRYW